VSIFRNLGTAVTNQIDILDEIKNGLNSVYEGKSRVKLPLCFTKHQAMKAYWGCRGVALDLGTRWRWVVSFTPRSLYPPRKIPSIHWIGGWVGPRAVLDAVVKRKIPIPLQESNPRTLIVQPIAQRCTNWAITVLVYEGLSKSFWTDRLKRELQTLQSSSTRCSCIAMLWVTLASFTAITLCVVAHL
jgi:hypothetical protein